MTLRRKPLRGTGVRLEQGVIDFLDALAKKEDRNRSYMINRIVREYAEQTGARIPSGAETAEPKRVRTVR